LERHYYNPALTILQASTEEHWEVVVVSGDYTKGDGSRGDLWVYVDGHEYLSVMKAVNGSSNNGTDTEGIHSNKRTGFQSFICTFLNRNECIWFVKFEFEGKDVKRWM
jgi:hypothetical protein